MKDTEGEIFIFNSDVICRFPLQEMLNFHRKHGKEGTIATTKVKDPSKFGVILTNENNKILNFIEKPQEFISDNINAGLYIFNKKFLDRVNPVPTSIEREVFPQMAKDGELYIYELEGLWADVGQPKDYLHGTNLYLNDLAKRLAERKDMNQTLDLPSLASGPNISGKVIIVNFIQIIIKNNFFLHLKFLIYKKISLIVLKDLLFFRILQRLLQMIV